MRLNLLNTSTVVGLAVSTVSCNAFIRRHGTVAGIDGEAFKYTPPDKSKGSLTIRKVSLNELFDGIPQDLTQFTATVEPREVDEGHLSAVLGLDPLHCEPPLVNLDVEPLPESDTLGHLFQHWQATVGLYGLDRREVILSLTDRTLHIDAQQAVLFTGTVAVTISKD